jgi:exonuclease SbcC
MKIESLFIDEGFGSLDSETLGTAMDALECLQAQGRKIGLISHVAEVTERIAAQIRVVKKENGQSVVVVVSC